MVVVGRLWGKTSSRSNSQESQVPRILTDSSSGSPPPILKVDHSHGHDDDAGGLYVKPRFRLYVLVSRKSEKSTCPRSPGKMVIMMTLQSRSPGASRKSSEVSFPGLPSNAGLIIFPQMQVVISIPSNHKQELLLLIIPLPDSPASSRKRTQSCSLAPVAQYAK